MQSESGNPTTACCPRRAEHVYCHLRAAESESMVKMNGRRELQIENGPAGGLSHGVEPRNVNANDMPSRFGIKSECIFITTAASLVTFWQFSSPQALLVPNGGSSVLVLSACAKAVYRVYVRIWLPTVMQLVACQQTAGLCCASSIRVELPDMAGLAALKAFVPWENRIGVVRGSGTPVGTLPANRGASAAAAPAAKAAAPSPAARWNRLFKGP